MRDQLEQRRDELAGELRSGQEMLADLNTRRAELEQTLLRISGALQVLTELLDASADQADQSEQAQETEEADRVSRPVAAVG